MEFMQIVTPIYGFQLALVSKFAVVGYLENR